MRVSRRGRHRTRARIGRQGANAAGVAWGLIKLFTHTHPRTAPGRARAPLTCTPGLCAEGSADRGIFAATHCKRCRPQGNTTGETWVRRAPDSSVAAAPLFPNSKRQGGRLRRGVCVCCVGTWICTNRKGDIMPWLSIKPLSTRSLCAPPHCAPLPPFHLRPPPLKSEWRLRERGRALAEERAALEQQREAGAARDDLLEALTLRLHLAEVELARCARRIARRGPWHEPRGRLG
jgi:hypothetical protein